MKQIFKKQEVTLNPFDCVGALKNLRDKEKLRDDFDSDISTYEFNLRSYEFSIKETEKLLKISQDLMCGDLEEAEVEEARINLVYFDYPCYAIPVICPLLYYKSASLNSKIEKIRKCVADFKVKDTIPTNPHPTIPWTRHIPWTEHLRAYLKEYEQNSKDIRKLLTSWRTSSSKLSDEITELNSDINRYGCNGPFVKDFTRLIECNKSKEIIRKLKTKYFELSKNILDIKLGLNGIKFLKVKKKSLIELKPIIEEVIKKGEYLKRYVIETDDEKAFFTLHSSNKVILAQNIKEQSMIEANLKNLLIKKEKTNRILRRTKKLLYLKIKQSVKLCN